MIDNSRNSVANAAARRKAPSGFGETVRTIVFAILIAVGIRTVAFEPFNIPSGSMIPTLLVGDYLFVSKYSYGYSKHSLPLSLPLIPGRVLAREPKRGDVVVFKLPRDGKTDYIKRVIGLPGDRIQIRSGRLYINDSLVPRERIADYINSEPGGYEVRSAQFVETLPGGTRHRILEISDNGPLDNTDTFTVPPANYFMMGDNRDNSLDSRVGAAAGGVGFVPFENLVGRAEFLFFSTDGSAALWEPWKWFSAARYSRLFQAVD